MISKSRREGKREKKLEREGAHTHTHNRGNLRRKEMALNYIVCL